MLRAQHNNKLEDLRVIAESTVVVVKGHAKTMRTANVRGAECATCGNIYAFTLGVSTQECPHCNNQAEEKNIITL